MAYHHRNRRGFSHEKLWFSIVLCMFIRGYSHGSREFSHFHSCTPTTCDGLLLRTAPFFPPPKWQLQSWSQYPNHNHPEYVVKKYISYYIIIIHIALNIIHVYYIYIYIYTYMHTRIFIQWISMKNRLRRASWCKKQAFFASKPLIELKAPAAVASSKEKKPQVTPSRSLDGWGGSNI